MYKEFIYRLNQNTWKKKILKFSLSTIQYLNFTSLILRSSKQDDNVQHFRAGEFIVQLEKQTGLSQLKAVFFYPPQENRDRCYAYVFNYNSVCICYVKIALSPHDRRFLINESRAISIIKEINFKFKIPDVMVANFEYGYSYIAYAPFNKQAYTKATKWDEKPFEFRNEILGLVRPRKLNECDWWHSLNTIGPDRPDCFLSSVAAQHSGSILMGRVHGDLTENNIFYDGNDAIICDWEYFEEFAPYCVDQLSFHLSKYQRLVEKNPFLGFKFIATAFFDNCSDEVFPERMINFKMALGYLHAVGNIHAKKITTEWSTKFEDLLNGIWR